MSEESFLAHLKSIWTQRDQDAAVELISYRKKTGAPFEVPGYLEQETLHMIELGLWDAEVHWKRLGLSGPEEGKKADEGNQARCEVLKKNFQWYPAHA